MHEVAIIPAEDARDERFRLHPVGAGPFKVEETREGQSIRLRRNRDYYLPGQPHLDELTFRLDLQHVPRRHRRLPARRAGRRARSAAEDRPASCRRIRVTRRTCCTTVQLHTSYFALRLLVGAVQSRRDPAGGQPRHQPRPHQRAHLRRLGASSPAASSRPASSATTRIYAATTTIPERARALMRQGGQAGGFPSSTAPGTRMSSTTPAPFR